MNPPLTKVSKYISYLLRHNPENLEMDNKGFVDLDELILKLQERYDVDKRFIKAIVNSPNPRFEVDNNRIRALYGHTVDVDIARTEDTSSTVLYHGTTLEATTRILRDGLNSMRRQWVHLSPTKDIARDVGGRRTANPVILEVDAKAARDEGIRFYKVTETVFLCSRVPPRYVKMTTEGS